MQSRPAGIFHPWKVSGPGNEALDGNKEEDGFQVLIEEEEVKAG